MKHTPVRWEIITGIQIIDADGWSGPEDWKREISEAEFRDKANGSTIRLHDEKPAAPVTPSVKGMTIDGMIALLIQAKAAIGGDKGINLWRPSDSIKRIANVSDFMIDARYMKTYNLRNLLGSDRNNIAFEIVPDEN